MVLESGFLEDSVPRFPPSPESGNEERAEQSPATPPAPPEPGFTKRDLARIAALEERMARAEGALVRLGLERCPTCGLWLPHQALASGADCDPNHAGLLRQEAR